jgi:hypothetical protein
VLAPNLCRQGLHWLSGCERRRQLRRWPLSRPDHTPAPPRFSSPTWWARPRNAVSCHVGAERLLRHPRDRGGTALRGGRGWGDSSTFSGFSPGSARRRTLSALVIAEHPCSNATRLALARSSPVDARGMGDLIDIETPGEKALKERTGVVETLGTLASRIEALSDSQLTHALPPWTR